MRMFAVGPARALLRLNVNGNRSRQSQCAASSATCCTPRDGFAHRCKRRATAQLQTSVSSRRSKAMPKRAQIGCHGSPADSGIPSPDRAC